jgi:hypothetical protein
MSDHLDTHVAKTVFKVALLERALHDSGPWYLEWCGRKVQAERSFGQTSISFEADFSGTFTEPESLLLLHCRGEVVACKVLPELMSLRPDDPAVLCWTMVAETRSVTVSE